MASHTYSPEAHSRTVTKYVKNNYDRIEMKVTKESGIKGKLIEHADKTGETVNAFLKRAALETMERDNEKLKQSQSTITGQSQSE